MSLSTIIKSNVYRNIVFRSEFALYIHNGDECLTIIVQNAKGLRLTLSENGFVTKFKYHYSVV